MSTRFTKKELLLYTVALMPIFFRCLYRHFSQSPFDTQPHRDDHTLACIQALGIQLCAYLCAGAEAIRDGACWIGRQIVVFPSVLKTACVNGTQWLGRQITPLSQSAYRHVICPVKEGLIQIGSYSREHYRAILAHLFAWGLILVCYGSLYGFHAVALRMLIGMGPGCLGGMLLGALIAKTFHHPIKGTEPSSSLIGRISQHIDAIPSWTRTLLIAVIATIHLSICCTIPYAGGAVSGAFFGAIFIYNGLRHNSQSPDVPHAPISMEDAAEAKRLLEQHLQTLAEQARVLNEQIHGLQQQMAEQKSV